MTDSITNTDDLIDSREVIDRIRELQEAWAESTGDDPTDYAMSEDDWAVGIGEDDARELVALMAFAEEAESAPDWLYGETFIHEDYFQTYAQELAEDIGAVDREAAWPLSYIDWEAAADALRIDYTEYDFDGQTYLARG